MPLVSALMIPDFRLALNNMNIVPEPFAIAFCAGLRKYLASGVNIGINFLAPCNYIFHIDPLAPIISASRMFNVEPAIFATQLATAVDNAILSLYTFYQTSLVYIPGMLTPKFIASFSKFNIVPEVLALELATAIDVAVRSVVITVQIPQLLFIPLPGPFI